MHQVYFMCLNYFHTTGIFNCFYEWRFDSSPILIHRFTQTVWFIHILTASIKYNSTNTQTKRILMMETVHVLMLGVQYKWCVKLGEMMSEDGNHCKHFLIGCCWLEFSWATFKAKCSLGIKSSVEHRVLCDDTQGSFGSRENKKFTSADV